MDFDPKKFLDEVWDALEKKYGIPGYYTKWTPPRKDPVELPRAFEFKSMYELTLTTDKDDPYLLRSAFHKIVRSKMADAVHWEAAIELTKNGLPHLHAIIYTKSKYIHAKAVQQYFDKRFSLSKVISETNWIKYIQKELSNKDISAYCQKKGIPQYWKHGEEQVPEDPTPVQEAHRDPAEDDEDT